MTSTPPPPAIKEHRYAISDERIAQLYNATEQQDCAMLMFHRDDVLGLIQRLRAAEAVLDDCCVIAGGIMARSMPRQALLNTWRAMKGGGK